MSSKRMVAMVVTLAGAVVFGALITLGAPGSQAAHLATATQVASDIPRREADSDSETPALSFIDNPSATCYLPEPGTGACYIDWNYLNVTASSGQYVISMTVAIDNHLQAYHSGFFQTSMYIPGDMFAPGYKVTCGAPGSAGKPDLGESYSYIIRARETGGLTAANYGTVYCPADVVKIFLPILGKH
jgi:hypothetical protein